MNIAFACDHGGFILREPILDHLKKNGHKVVDLGPQSVDTNDDFPPFAGKVCEELLNKNSERGILICGSGIGMCIAANRYDHIQAFVAYSSDITRLSRQHNNTNVICFGGRTMKIEDVLPALDIFLTEQFIGGRYEKRNAEIDSLC